MRVRSFAPVAAPDARLLILGSMPGVASLSAGRYYAHPRNAFWPILGQVLGLAPEASYEQRLQALRAAGIALWDVLQSCERPGSLDGAIARDSIEPQDISGFLGAHPRVRSILFNGAAAEQLFRRHVLPGLIAAQDLRLVRLPSTSPAHAGMGGHEKLERWRQALLAAMQEGAG